MIRIGETPAAAALPDTNAVLGLAVEAGEIMLRSGAETSRVEETVDILVRALGLAASSCLVTPTGIYLSVEDPRLPQPVTLVHRVHGRAVNYQRIWAINDLSRRVAAGRMGLAEARAALDAVAAAPDPYPFAVWVGAGAASAAGVALLLGGAIVDVAPAFASTIVVLLLVTRLQQSRIPAFFGDFAGAATAAAVGLGLVWLGLPIHAGLVIAGGIMQLVPGAALLTAVQDGISGNLLSSAARALETLLKGAALATGVGLGLSGAVAVGMHVSVENLAAATWQMPIQVAAAFVASACYAVWYHVPRFAVLTGGLAGALGWLTYLLAGQIGISPLAGTFLAAFAVGALSWSLARRQRAPVTLYVLPGILPLLPGVTIYNGMLDLAQNQSIAGLLVLVHASFLGGALAAGVALSNALAPALRDRARRLPGPLGR